MSKKPEPSGPTAECVGRRLKDLLLQIRDGDPEVWEFAFQRHTGLLVKNESVCQQCKWWEWACECPGGGLFGR